MLTILETMKRKSINKFLVAAVALATGVLTSCEDYLTLYPTDSITKEYFWTTSNDVNNVRAAAYYQLSKNTNKIVEWGEIRSDNLVVNDMKQAQYRYMQEAVLRPTDGMFSWADMYTGINYCHEVLENGQRMIDQNIDPSFTQSDWLPIKAEMISLRALYYFYLVRAFRNVPYVEHSVSTDAEAIAARDSATAGVVILDSLINSVEAVLPYAATNYGNSIENKGRWTNQSIHALLADMYLWRAGLVSHAKAKGFPVRKSDGTILTEAEENALAGQLLVKSVEHADVVLNKMMKDYQERLDLASVPQQDKRREVYYPLIPNEDLGLTMIDIPYSFVLGSRNSIESIFELQYDGVNTHNGTFPDLFYGNADGGFKAGKLTANPALFNAAQKVDPVKGYGRTDFRFLSYGFYEPDAKSSITPIIKSVNTRTLVFDPTNVLKGGTVSFVNSKSSNASWQVYRLADIMMIKAEAIARLKAKPFENPNYDVRVAFRAADELFHRNNPKCDTVNSTNEDLYCVRVRQNKIDKDYADKSKIIKERYGAYGQNALYLVYCERQREFLGEGKRWFDLVRECEFKGSTKETLSDWMGASTSVRNRLRHIISLYNPIHVDELKANGKGYGNGDGKLVQNPTWERYMPKM